MKSRDQRKKKCWLIWSIGVHLCYKTLFLFAVADSFFFESAIFCSVIVMFIIGAFVYFDKLYLQRLHLTNLILVLTNTRVCAF